MNIILFELSKRYNSTKAPDVQYNPSVTLDCLMKSSASILTPVVEVKLNSTLISAFEYNYAYIPDLKRYYYIDNVTYDLGIWTLSLVIDVLATYRHSIRASTQYLMRSTDFKDGSLLDSMYNSKIFPTARYDYSRLSSDNAYQWAADRWNVQTNYFQRNYNQGVVVVGIVSGSVTGISYYWFLVDVWKSFVDRVLNYVPADMGSLGDGIKAQLFDPIQYINSVTWYPFAPLGGPAVSEVSTIQMGRYPINTDFNGYKPHKIEDTAGIGLFKCDSIDLPVHPTASSSPYKKLAPYSEYTLQFEPWGTMPLDTSLLYGASELDCEWQIDYITGSCILDVTTDLGTRVLHEASNIGVPLSIAKTVVDDKIGVAYSVGSALVGSVSNLVDKLGVGARQGVSSWSDVFPPIGGAPKIGSQEQTNTPIQTVSDNINTAQNILDTIVAIKSQVRQQGSRGSMLGYNVRPTIHAYFIDQTEADPQRFGYPCMASHSLEFCEGYNVCANASVNFTGQNGIEPMPLKSERDAVIQYMNSGIYLDDSTK